MQLILLSTAKPDYSPSGVPCGIIFPLTCSRCKAFVRRGPSRNIKVKGKNEEEDRKSDIKFSLEKIGFVKRGCTFY